jgi:CO/xanthine dehydrogenase FAD-binding subunit
MSGRLLRPRTLDDAFYLLKRYRRATVLLGPPAREAREAPSGGRGPVSIDVTGIAQLDYAYLSRGRLHLGLCGRLPALQGFAALQRFTPLLAAGIANALGQVGLGEPAEDAVDAAPVPLSRGVVVEAPPRGMELHPPPAPQDPAAAVRDPEGADPAAPSLADTFFPGETPAGLGAALLALDARVLIRTRKSRRTLTVPELIELLRAGPLRGEIPAEIVFPVQQPGERWLLLPAKPEARDGGETVIALRAGVEAERICLCRVAVERPGADPRRLPEAEQALQELPFQALDVATLAAALRRDLEQTTELPPAAREELALTLAAGLEELLQPEAAAPASLQGA